MAAVMAPAEVDPGAVGRVVRVDRAVGRAVLAATRAVGRAAARVMETERGLAGTEVAAGRRGRGLPYTSLGGSATGN